MYLCYFVLILPWKTTGPLISNKLESTLPKDALCQVCLKFAHGSGEEDENVNENLQAEDGQQSESIRKAHLSLKERYITY